MCFPSAPDIPNLPPPGPSNRNVDPSAIAARLGSRGGSGAGFLSTFVADQVAATDPSSLFRANAVGVNR